MLTRTIFKKTAPSCARPFGQILNYHKKYVTLDVASNKKGLLRNITKAFENRSLNLNYIDGRHLMIMPDGTDVVRFNACFDSNRDSDLNTLQEEFMEMGIKMRNVDPENVPWFPVKESDLDKLGKVLQNPSDGLNQDHPGFTDQVYKQRRNLIADNSKDYKMGTPIPGFEYDKNETNLWSFIWDKLYPNLIEHGCAEYKQNLNKLVDNGFFKREKIP